MKCPVKRCKYSPDAKLSETEQENVLFGHLFTRHRKSEVIEALLKKEDLKR